PTGKTPFPLSANQNNVKHAREKYLSSVFRKIVIVFARPASPRGALRHRHETLGAGCDGRFSRQLRMTGETDGKSVWSWHPDAGVKFVDDSCGRRGLKSPAPRGERAISRKPLRRECRCFGVPAAFSFCMRAAGATGASGAPCTLFFGG